jgi:hypothetical protein
MITSVRSHRFRLVGGGGIVDASELATYAEMLKAFEIEHSVKLQVRFAEDGLISVVDLPSTKIEAHSAKEEDDAESRMG